MLGKKGQLAGDREEKMRRGKEERKRREDRQISEDDKRLFKAILSAVLMAIPFLPIVGASLYSPIGLTAISVTGSLLPPGPPWPLMFNVFVPVVVVLGVAYLSYNKNSLGIGIIGFILLAVPMAFISAVPTVFPELATGFEKYVCMGKYWDNPNAADICGLMTGETPEAEKVGSEEVVKVTFDTSVSERLRIRSDSDELKLNMYSIPIEIENPSDEKTIEGFYIKSANVHKGGNIKSSEKDDIGDLVADRCNSASSSCEIGPNQKIRISLKGSEAVEDPETDEVEIRVEFSYEYSNEGHNDFIIAKTLEGWKEAYADSEGRKSFEGPIDVVVWFWPESVIIDEMPEIGETKDLYVYISLSKEETRLSYADIKNPIEIIRVDEGASSDLFEGQAICETRWDPEIDLSMSDAGDELPLGADLRQLRTDHLYSCKYTLKREFSSIEESKTIKFIVRANYSFVDTKIQKDIVIIRD
jgi:hypothetical protein